MSEAHEEHRRVARITQFPLHNLTHELHNQMQASSTFISTLRTPIPRLPQALRSRGVPARPGGLSGRELQALALRQAPRDAWDCGFLKVRRLLVLVWQWNLQEIRTGFWGLGMGALPTSRPLGGHYSGRHLQRGGEKVQGEQTSDVCTQAYVGLHT